MKTLNFQLKRLPSYKVKDHVKEYDTSSTIQMKTLVIMSKMRNIILTKMILPKMSLTKATLTKMMLAKRIKTKSIMTKRMNTKRMITKRIMKITMITTEIPKILIKFAYKDIEEDDEQDSIELIALGGRGSCYQIFKTVLKSVGFGSCHSKNGSFGALGTTRRRRWSRTARLAPTLGIDSAIPFTLPARTSGRPSHSRINASDFLFVAPYLPVPF